MNQMISSRTKLMAVCLISLLGFAPIAMAQDANSAQQLSQDANSAQQIPQDANSAQQIPQDANSAQQTASSTSIDAASGNPKSEVARQMLAFFDGMMAAVDAKTGDCEAMSQALQAYYHEHHAWISSLDYATGNLDSETMASVHEKAVAFGKKLSVCYDQKSIPAQLHRYAGMGEEFE